MTRSKTNNPSKKSSTRKTGKSKGRPRGWRVIKILDEHQETGMFLVHWDGINPGTGRPWHDSWIPRENFFTNKLLKEWDIYKQKQKRQFCKLVVPPSRNPSYGLRKSTSMPSTPVGRGMSLPAVGTHLDSPTPFSFEQDSEGDTPLLLSDSSNTDDTSSYGSHSQSTINGELDVSLDFSTLLQVDQLDVSASEWSMDDMIGNEMEYNFVETESSSFSFSKKLDEVHHTYPNVEKSTTTSEGVQVITYHQVVMHQCPFDKSLENVLYPLMRHYYPRFTSMRYIDGTPDSVVCPALSTFPTLWRYTNFASLTAPSERCLSDLEDVKDAMDERKRAMEYLSKIEDQLRVLAFEEVFADNLKESQLDSVNAAVGEIRRMADGLRIQLAELEARIQSLKLET